MKPSPAKKLRAVIYCRFSPRPNSSDCDSNEKQENDLRDLCKQRGYIVDDILVFRDDAVSGKSAERIKFQAALIAAKKGGRRMVFVARDVKRLGRGWDVFAVVMDLVAHGVRIETIADGTFDAQDPNALAVWGIKIVVGSIERLTISKTTSQKMRRNQDAGRRMSHIIPFGMKTDPNSPLSTRPQTKKIDGTTSAPRPIGLIPDDGEQVVLAHMLELRAKGKGVRLIAKHLNAAGADDAAWLHRGRRWLPETVRRILKRAKRTE